MNEVTQQQFYAALSADNRDIMPSIVGKWDDEIGYVQEWRTQHGGQLFGRTEGRQLLGSGRYFLGTI